MKISEEILADVRREFERENPCWNWDRHLEKYVLRGVEKGMEYQRLKIVAAAGPLSVGSVGPGNLKSDRPAPPVSGMPRKRRAQGAPGHDA